jgi:hypothetical protein
VVEPSNAWSNAAYVMVGLWILWRRRARPATALTSIGVAAVLLGVGSFSFHATGIRLFEVVDVSGMYLISGLALTFALQRALGWGDGIAVGFFAASVLLSGVLMVALGNNGIAMFALQTIAAIGIEARLWPSTPAAIAPWMLRAVVAFVAALFVWVLDKHGPLCDPDNHVVTGHAVWHVLTAVAILFFFHFHERLRDAGMARAR